MLSLGMLYVICYTLDTDILNPRSYFSIELEAMYLPTCEYKWKFCYLKLGVYVNYELQQNMNLEGLHSNTYHSPSDSKQQKINNTQILYQIHHVGISYIPITNYHINDLHILWSESIQLNIMISQFH